jgi:formate/nitrite transporter
MRSEKGSYKVSNNQALSPREIREALDAIAEKKASATMQQQFFLAVLAGIYIGFGAVVATVVTSGSGLDEGLKRFLGGSVFSVGLMLVLIPGSELFTGNILMSVGFLSRRVHPLRILRNWVVVWIGNFAGAMLLAWLIIKSNQLVDDGVVGYVGERAIAITERKLELATTFWACFIRGVLCNMLVCLAVIMATSARTVSGKILGIYFPIMTFVACGFEHSIANMYFLPAGLMAAGQLGARFGDMLFSLFAVTLGNILGGLTLILLHPGNQQMVGRLFRKSNPRTQE